MTNKKFWSIIWILVLFVTGILVLNQRTAVNGNLIVGAILPLSGNTAFIGEDMKRGLNLGATPNFRLQYEDSGGETKKMVSSYQKLVATDKPAIIIAAGTGVEALIPLAEKDQIPLMITVSSASDLPRQGEYIFRYFTNADNDAPTMAKYATSDLGLKKFAVIYVQDQFGIDYKDIFEKEVAKNGGSVVIADSYKYTDFDFKTQISKIKQTDYDVIYVIGLDYQLVPLIQQIKNADITKQILSTGTIATADNIKKLGKTAEGIYLTAFCTDGSPESYVNKFKEKYNSYPGFFSEIGFDLDQLIINATKDGTRKEQIIKGLLATKAFQANTGVLSSDSYGEIIIPMCVKKITGGKIFNTATGNYSNY